ncbi:hypothetical protein [Ruminococcus sp. FC2018]|uniref:hypothetical protein n=1 Tax=Ruminococcus sp. FC2018 TaxID=1410617 RepID=UPI00048F6F3C|nr:hypothetical protein [Ruminococcus sp. FC2018]
MLVYEYPPKLSHGARQAKAIHDIEQHKKIRRGMIRNMAIAVTIIALSFFVDIMLVKLVLILIAAANAAVGLLLYRYGMMSFDAKVYSRIYDDHLEHSQRVGFSKRYLCFDVLYKDFEKSFQDPNGNLVVQLAKDHSAKVWTADENGGDKQDHEIKNNTLTLKFADTKAKLTLVNDFYEQIKYPHKEYNVIEDDDDDYYTDDDKKWDSLGKHGL